MRYGTRLGRRRGPAVPLSAEARSSATAARRARAHEGLFDIRPVPGVPYLALEVANPIRGSRYQVHLPAYPDPEPAICECTDFARRGLGTCKHLEAVRLWLQENPGAGPGETLSPWPRTPAFWRELDALELSRRRDPAPASIAWRRPGALLYRELSDSA
jgi:hypothetical protein